MASLKAEVDVDRLKTVTVDLSKLSNIVNNDVVKKTVYNKLLAKLNNIDARGFVLETKYDTDKSNLEKKIGDTDKKVSDTSDFVNETDLNAKITETESKIPSISGLATNSALAAVENKILGVSSLVKKKNYNAKILGIEKKATVHDHDKYITTSELNKLKTENFAVRLARVNLVTMADFDAKLISLNKKN